MKILVTNDDGVYSPGIKALFEAMNALGDAWVVAPDRDMSATSNSLTLRTPLRSKQIAEKWYAVEGTPTDSVHLALHVLLAHDKPDIVVSGINDGANLGDDIPYSGTVAAAMEGRFMGLPAIAFSLSGPDRTDYTVAARVAKHLVENALLDPLPQDMFLNVNVPNIPFDEIAGIEVVRLGKRHASERVITDTDPKGKPIYWVGMQGAEQDAGPGTDFHAVKTRHVAVTPISLDMTHYKHMDRVGHWAQTVRGLCGK